MGESAIVMPAMTEAEFADLKEDIRKHGCIHDVELYDGQILDGRHRHRACKELGKATPCRELLPDDVPDPMAYVLSVNVPRRHLKDSQKGMIAARAKQWYTDQAKKRQQAAGGDRTSAESKGKALVEKLPPPLDAGKARDKAGESVGVSGKTVDYGGRVLDKGIPELIKAVDDGRVAVSTAAKISAWSASEQRKWLVSQPEKPRRRAKDDKPKGGDGRPDVKHRATSAMQLVRIAISQLERIRVDDPERDKAFQYLKTWIKENWK